MSTASPAFDRHLYLPPDADRADAIHGNGAAHDHGHGHVHHDHDHDHDGHGHHHHDHDGHDHEHMHFEKTDLRNQAAMTVLIKVAETLGLNPVASGFAYGLTVYAKLGVPVLRSGVEGLIKDREINTDLFMSVAALLSAARGDFFAGGVLLLIYGYVHDLGEDLEHAYEKVLNAVLAERPAFAERLRPDGTAEAAATADLAVGDEVRIGEGGRTPTDIEVVEGVVAVDLSATTGESVLVTKGPGDFIPEGVTLSAPIRARVRKPQAESSLTQTIERVYEGRQEKSEGESRMNRFLNKFVKFATAYAGANVAVEAALSLQRNLPAMEIVTNALDKGTMALIDVGSCALIPAIPVPMAVARARAAQAGLAFDSNKAFEAMGKVSCVVLDKTGTLTVKTLDQVSDLHPVNGVAPNELLNLIGRVESHSEHPVARAVQAASGRHAPDESVSEFMNHGRFVTAQVEAENGAARSVKIGARNTFDDAALADDIRTRLDAEQAAGKSPMLVEVDGRIVGAFSVSERVRPEAAAFVQRLKADGNRVMILSGDQEEAVREVAESLGLGLDEYRAQVTPEQKLDTIRALKAGGDTVAMFGDGVNDALALEEADLGIAIEDGTRAARGSADAKLSRGLMSFFEARDLSHQTESVIRENLSFALSVIGILQFMEWVGGPMLGINMGALEHVIGHEVSTLLVILNSLRLLVRNREREADLGAEAERHGRRRFRPMEWIRGKVDQIRDNGFKFEPLQWFRNGLEKAKNAAVGLGKSADDKLNALRAKLPDHPFFDRVFGAAGAAAFIGLVQTPQLIATHGDRIAAFGQELIQNTDARQLVSLAASNVANFLREGLLNPAFIGGSLASAGTSKVVLELLKQNGWMEKHPKLALLLTIGSASLAGAATRGALSGGFDLAGMTEQALAGLAVGGSVLWADKQLNKWKNSANPRVRRFGDWMGRGARVATTAAVFGAGVYFGPELQEAVNNYLENGDVEAAVQAAVVMPDAAAAELELPPEPPPDWTLFHPDMTGPVDTTDPGITAETPSGLTLTDAAETAPTPESGPDSVMPMPASEATAAPELSSPEAPTSVETADTVTPETELPPTMEAADESLALTQPLGPLANQIAAGQVEVAADGAYLLYLQGGNGWATELPLAEGHNVLRGSDGYALDVVIENSLTGIRQTVLYPGDALFGGALGVDATEVEFLPYPIEAGSYSNLAMPENPAGDGWLLQLPGGGAVNVLPGDNIIRGVDPTGVTGQLEINVRVGAAGDYQVFFKGMAGFAE